MPENDPNGPRASISDFYTELSDAKTIGTMDPGTQVCRICSSCVFIFVCLFFHTLNKQIYIRSLFIAWWLRRITILFIQVN